MRCYIRQVPLTQLSQTERAAGWGSEETYAVHLRLKVRSGLPISDN